MKGHSGGLEALNALLQEHGVQLNEEGGAIKVGTAPRRGSRP